jgi:hypothetical protein
MDTSIALLKETTMSTLSSICVFAFLHFWGKEAKTRHCVNQPPYRTTPLWR